MVNVNKKLPHGKIELIARGKLVMLTKLKDGLRKTLRLPRPDLRGDHEKKIAPEFLKK